MKVECIRVWCSTAWMEIDVVAFKSGPTIFGCNRIFRRPFRLVSKMSASTGEKKTSMENYALATEAQPENNIHDAHAKLVNGIKKITFVSILSVLLVVHSVCAVRIGISEHRVIRNAYYKSSTSSWCMATLYGKVAAANTICFCALEMRHN